MRAGEERCAHCGRVILNLDRLVWLELNGRTGEWAKHGEADWSDGPESKGVFTFNQQCSYRVLKDQKCDWKGVIRDAAF